MLFSYLQRRIGKCGGNAIKELQTSFLNRNEIGGALKMFQLKLAQEVTNSKYILQFPFRIS